MKVIYSDKGLAKNVSGKISMTTFQRWHARWKLWKFIYRVIYRPISFNLRSWLPVKFIHSLSCHMIHVSQSTLNERIFLDNIFEHFPCEHIANISIHRLAELRRKIPEIIIIFSRARHYRSTLKRICLVFLNKCFQLF